MTLTASDTSHGIATPVVMIVAIIAGIIYTFGYLRAVMHRANSDYKATKALVPTLRKGFWHAWWKAVKIGFWVFVAGTILIFWAYRDVANKGADATPRSTPSAAVTSHNRR